MAADTDDETLPLLDLMVESRMSRERAERQLAAGLVTVDGQPVTDPTTLVCRTARVVIHGQ